MQGDIDDATNEDKQSDGTIYHQYRWRWFMLATLFLLNVSNGMVCFIILDIIYTARDDGLRAEVTTAWLTLNLPFPFHTDIIIFPTYVQWPGGFYASLALYVLSYLDTLSYCGLEDLYFNGMIYQFNSHHKKLFDTK